MNRGTLLGVGLGPGDPELVSIKAIKAIQNAHVLIFPGKSKEDCRAYDIAKDYIEKDFTGKLIDNSNRDIVFMPFPMSMNKDELAKFHDEVCLMIIKYLDARKDVAFMTIGDPTIYSTFSYVNQIISGRNYKTEIINGISSINAVAGRLGTSLVDGSEMLHVIPGSANIEESLKLEGTKVYMKSGKKLKKLLDILRNEANNNPNLKVMGVSNCGMPSEEVFYGLDEIPDSDRYLMTMIVFGSGSSSCK